MDLNDLRQKVTAALEIHLMHHTDACGACKDAVSRLFASLGAEGAVDEVSRKRNLAQRNNNPGNLIFVGQRGAEKGERSFARWPTPEEGWVGLLRQVELDQGRGLTMREFITKYAPPTENDSITYIRNMCRWLNCKPDSMLSSIDAGIISVCLARQEGYFHLA
jgi:hypothetical protein